MKLQWKMNLPSSVQRAWPGSKTHLQYYPTNGFPSLWWTSYDLQGSHIEAYHIIIDYTFPQLHGICIPVFVIFPDWLVFYFS